jgi:hypothetical protein
MRAFLADIGRIGRAMNAVSVFVEIDPHCANGIIRAGRDAELLRDIDLAEIHPLRVVGVDRILRHGAHLQAS